jgi:hypothetical protein
MSPTMIAAIRRFMTAAHLRLENHNARQMTQSLAKRRLVRNNLIARVNRQIFLASGSGVLPVMIHGHRRNPPRSGRCGRLYSGSRRQLHCTLFGTVRDKEYQG